MKSFRHAYKNNPVITIALVLMPSALPDVLHNSYNMGTCDLPDMYARSPGALDIHIGQITHTHVTTGRP